MKKSTKLKTARAIPVKKMDKQGPTTGMMANASNKHLTSFVKSIAMAVVLN